MDVRNLRLLSVVSPWIDPRIQRIRQAGEAFRPGTERLCTRRCMIVKTNAKSPQNRGIHAILIKDQFRRRAALPKDAGPKGLRAFARSSIVVQKANN